MTQALGQPQGGASVPLGHLVIVTTPPPFRPWRPNPWTERARSFLGSPNFQLAVQLSLGTVLLSAFTFVKQMKFVGACFAYTIFLVVCVMMSPNNHVGTRLTSACALLGCTWVALIPASLLSTAAKLMGPPLETPAALALYCTFGPALVALLLINRVADAPPQLWSRGMNTLLVAGSVMISGYLAYPLDRFWAASLGQGTLAGNALGVAGCLVVSLLVLPSLATDQVRATIADVLRGAGHAASSNASRLLCPLERLPSCVPNVLLLGPQVVEVLPGLAIPDESRDEEELVLRHLLARASIRDGCAPPPRPPNGAPGSKQTAPPGGCAPQCVASSGCIVPTSPPVYCLRPKLRSAAALLPAAAVEPPWLLSAPYDAAAFQELVLATGALLDSLVAVESVLQDGVATFPHGDPSYADALAQTHAHAAAALQGLSRALGGLRQAAGGGRQGLPQAGGVGICGCNWEGLRGALREGAKREQEAYWQYLKSGTQEAPAMARSVVQAGVVFFSYAAAQAVIDATQRVERGVERVLGLPTGPPTAGAASSVAPGGVTPPAVAAAAPPSAAPGPRRAGGGCGGCGGFFWLKPLSRELLCIDMFLNCKDALGRRLPAGLGSAQGFRQMTSGRHFQAGAKMWLVLAPLLVATLVLLHYGGPSLSGNKVPMYGFLAAVLSVSERTEATVSKMVFWLAGTLIGSTLGLALMSHPALAGSPLALGAALAAAAAAVGALGSSQFRVTVTLTLMTLGAMVLCQYKGCCSDATGGSIEFYLSRVVASLTGVLLAAAASSLVAPWYTSCWALEVLAGAFERAAALQAMGYSKFYDDAAALERERAKGGGGGGAPAGAWAAAPVEVEAAAGANRGAGVQPREAPWEAASAAAAPAPAGVFEAGAATDPAGGAAAAKTTAAVATAAADAADAAAEGLAPPAASFDQYRPMLHSSVVQPLTAVQVSLMMDTTMWQRGVLATPCVVPQMLHAMLSLVGPLEAMQLAMRPPEITGAFSGDIFKHYVVAMHSLRTPIILELQKLAKAVSVHLLQGPTEETAADLQKEIDTLLLRRVAARAQFAKIKIAYHEAMTQHPGDWRDKSNSDAVLRVLGFQHALFCGLDLSVGVAKVALHPRCKGRNSAKSLLK